MFDEPPLGGAGGGATGFVTVIGKNPAAARSLADRATCSAVLLMKPVGRFVLFTATTDCETKWVPVTSSLALPDPANTIVGDTELIVGTLLGAGVMMNVRLVEVPPPGEVVNTSTVADPGF